MQKFPLPWLALLFLPGCLAPSSQGPRVDPQYARESNAALAAFDQGLTPQAVMLYQRALARGEAMDNAQYIGDAGYNLAIALTRTGNPTDLARARVVLHEARQASQRSGGDTPGVILLEAKVARMQGDRGAAASLAEQVLQQSSVSAANRVWALVLKGDLAADVKDLSAASAQLQLARHSAHEPSTSQQAALVGLAARLDLLSHDLPHAAAQFDQQADLLQQAGLYREMAQARAHAGQAYLEANNPSPAADRLYRAARSAAAQGDSSIADPWFAQAAQAARQANDPWLIEQIQQQISATTHPTAP